jgi:phosphoglycerate dehydrogenase-like enzyme
VPTNSAIAETASGELAPAYTFRQAATVWSVLPRLALAQAASLKIGIIGTGRIGGALAKHCASAGHQIADLLAPSRTIAAARRTPRPAGAGGGL